MNKAYKIILITLIVLTVSYLTYDHYTDPVYQLKVGTVLNEESSRIEDWGGRFNEDETIHIGFKTRLDEETQLVLRVSKEDENFVPVYQLFSISEEHFYHYTMSEENITPGNYIVEIYCEDTHLETTTFIIEEK